MGADDEVINSIAVHISRRGHRGAALVAPPEVVRTDWTVDAIQTKTVRAIERCKVDGRRETRALSEHHIALARGSTPARVCGKSPNDQIIKSVTVHISRRGHRAAAIVTRIYAVQQKTVLAIEPCEINARSKTGGFA